MRSLFGRFRRPFSTGTTSNTSISNTGNVSEAAGVDYERLFYNNTAVDQHASLPTTRFTLAQLTSFGRHMTPYKLLKSANYVRKELAIRIAHRMKDFQSLPFVVGMHPNIQKVYLLYSDAFHAIRNVGPISSIEQNKAFCQLLDHHLSQHAVAIPLLARGLMEPSTSHYLTPEKTDAFMNNMLYTRIGRRVLAEQHIAISSPFHANISKTTNSTQIGVIDTHCHAVNAVRKSVQMATETLLKMQPSVPDIVIDGHVDSTFMYISEQLDYILYETILHAMLSHARSTPQPIQVTIVETKQQDKTKYIFFRISNPGLAITRDQFPKKVPKNLTKSCRDFSSCPRFGFPQTPWSSPSCFANLVIPDKLYGKITDEEDVHVVETYSSSSECKECTEECSSYLPLGVHLSKAHVEYFGGTMMWMPMSGIGTDLYIRLAVNESEERLTSCE